MDEVKVNKIVDDVNSLSIEEREEVRKRIIKADDVRDVISDLPSMRYNVTRVVKHNSGDIYVKCYRDNDDMTDIIAPETLLNWFGLRPTDSQKRFFNAMCEIIVRNGGAVISTYGTSAWECMCELFPDKTEKSLRMQAYRILVNAREKKTLFWSEMFDNRGYRIDVPYFMYLCAMKVFELQSEM